MPLRILHVLSSNFFAGSAAYAIQLAERQAADGHDVYMVTDQAGLSDKITCLALPVSNRSLLQRVKNIWFLRKIIHEHDISVVHAHSRAASWISYYALLGTRVPLVSTIHGRQVKHSALKSNAIYGEKVIAICPELVEQLTQELQMNKHKVAFLPNPLDFEALRNITRSRTDNNRTIISVVGRLNGPKGAHISELVIQVFPHLLERHPDLTIQIIGGEWESFPRAGKDAFADLQSRFGERICYLGFTRQVLDLMADSDLVIGAGRVAMEALALDTAVFALGEACCIGLVSDTNLADAIATNFGDIRAVAAPFRPDPEAITHELEAFLSGEVSPAINYAELSRTYDINRIIPEILSTYSSAIMRKLSPRPIPVLMYHRVPDQPVITKHRTFVTRRNFEKHLRFFRLRGLQSITFQDYLDFSNGSRPLREFPKKPFILTFDDGYLDNFHNALPLTKKYGFKGVLFLLGDFSADGNFWDTGEDIEANRLMTTEQKKAFVEYGWEIGAHTMTHPHLTGMSDQEVLYELAESRKRIEQELQTKVMSFAYPFGSYDDRLKALVKQTGFTFGIATDNGGMTIKDDHFAVFRVNIFPDESLFSLFKKSSTWYRAYYHRKRGK
ncbi:MAG TPA: polysaccharide deacetylase family protein [Desulfuromonadales bacterium]|nr:polysaccharide deacetylase family protein [Desulfuromonadales bacterium]